MRLGQRQNVLDCFPFGAGPRSAPRLALICRLVGPTSLTAAANLLAFRATPDGLLCPGRDALLGPVGAVPPRPRVGRYRRPGVDALSPPETRQGLPSWQRRSAATTARRGHHGLGCAEIPARGRASGHRARRWPSALEPRAEGRGRE